MNKKSFLLIVALLIAGQLFAVQESRLITLSADGTETAYTLSEVQKIVFENNTMTVNMKSDSDATGITCVSFLLVVPVGIENPKLASSVFVFPNPVQTNLKVAGVEKNVKINLINLNGTLLQSIIAQDDSTDINVSSLPQGVYLLQVGDQVVKFIKQ
jgi:hypothetical protein